MKRKIIISLIGSILFLIGAIFFIKKSNEHSKIPQRDFIVVSIYRGTYPFNMTFKKNIIAKNVILKLHKTITDLENIYFKEGRKWNLINLNTELKTDGQIKLQYAKGK